MGNDHLQSAKHRVLTGVTDREFSRNAPISIRERALTLEGERALTLEGERFGAARFRIDPLPEPLPDPDVVDGRLNVPQAEARNGNLFAVADDPLQMWYLPDFALVDDPDPAFAFAASQTVEIDQETGTPFNKCRFSMALRKVMPADATSWIALHPDGVLREVPLDVLEGAIVVQSISHGLPQSTPFHAKVSAAADGTFVLTADTILGVGVIALYQNLSLAANARCTVSASFRARRVQPTPPLRPGEMATMMLRLETASLHFTTTLDIGRKYQLDAYRLDFTIATTGEPRAIINAEDLSGFTVRQSEYVELRALGDITTRYPSIGKAYFGVLSKTVVIIPARYVILRESASCDARCTALVDSSPGLNAGCKFQLEFTLVPDVSGIDLVLLLEELNAHAQTKLHGLTLHLPKMFKLGPEATLMSIFLSSFHFIEGVSDPHSISLSVEIREQLGGTPAVANVNLFLAQLRAVREPFLTGSIGVRLDDAFPLPIKVPVLLNFTQTQTNGAAGLALRLDEEHQKAVLANGSPFKLLVSRIALLTPQGVTVAALGQTIDADGEHALELPADHAGLLLLSDCELAIESELSKADLFKLLQFQTVDVQNTQFQLAVNASAVSFVGRAIDHIEMVIALSGSPDQPVATLRVMKERLFDSARVVLPFQQALIELNAILLVEVGFSDPARAPLQFKLENDFGQHPIFQIVDKDIAP